MTLHGVRFSEKNVGSNVCCMTSRINDEDVIISKSDRLNSFMQKDSLTINLGNVTNTGYTVRWVQACSA